MTLLAIFLLTGLQLPEPAFAAKMERVAAETGGPGTSAIVVKDGKTIYRKAFGLADSKTAKPFTTSMAFEIGSISKQFVATALLMLVNEKKLALADPLGTHLPEIPEGWKGATVEQTLHHMSGIPDYEAIAGYDYYNADRTEKDVIDQAASKKPEFKPGEKFDYSNTGYFLLSMIVSRKSGMPVGRYLEEKIFKPLAMTSTYAETRPARAIAATGYHRRSGQPTAQPPIAWSSTLGAGGIVSTLADIALWDQALYTDKLLPSSLRDLLWSTAKTTKGETINYGFGWFSGSYRGIPRQDHSGQTNGFTCEYFRFPAQKIGIFAVTNTYGGRTSPVASALAAHFVEGASYFSIQPIEENGTDRSKTHLKMLKQAVLGEGGHGLLADNLLNFATNKQFDGMRESMKIPISSMSVFRLLREKDVPSGGKTLREFTYRMTSTEGTTFWVLRVDGDKLAFMAWGDE